MTAICILGMHRSGTSTITRAFNLLGAYLGEEKDLMIPLPDNPEGYWERPDLYYLHERMLSVLKRDWASSAPLPENCYKSDEIRPLKEELVKLVEKNFSGRPLWLWKDPRTCLLLPLWKDVLSELNIDFKVVFAVRNPLDVARSLEKRDGFTLDKGMGIWFNYTLSALKGIEGLETVFLSYDRFLIDWETELKQCADGLGIEWPADEAGLRTEMLSFLRPSMRHSASGLDELHEMNAPEPVIRLHGVLLEILSGTGKLYPAAVKMIEDYYKEYLSYARFFDFEMAVLADYRLRFDEISSSPEVLPKILGLKKDLDKRTKWALKLNKEVKLLREQVASHQKKIKELLPLTESVDIELQKVLSSMSWKFLKPLRFAHELLMKLRKDK